jgi:hypothetical protein
MVTNNCSFGEKIAFNGTLSGWSYYHADNGLNGRNDIPSGRQRFDGP